MERVGLKHLKCKKEFWGTQQRGNPGDTVGDETWDSWVASHQGFLGGRAGTEEAWASGSCGALYLGLLGNKAIAPLSTG